MTIEFNCHSCGKLLRTGDEKAGRSASCPDCGEKLTVPETAAVDGHDDPIGGDPYDQYDDEFSTQDIDYAPGRRPNQSQNVLALLSMISGIIGAVVMLPGMCCGCLIIVSGPFDVAAIVMGSIALYQINNDGGSGRGMALTGIICGAVTIIVFIGMLVLGVAINMQQPQQFNF